MIASLVAAVPVGLALTGTPHDPALPMAHESPGQTSGGTLAPPDALTRAGLSAVPSGFQRAAGPPGTTVAVPSAWVRRIISGACVRWTDRSAGAQIQVDSIPWGTPDPVDRWRSFARETIASGRLPGFLRQRIGRPFTTHGWTGSDLEYTWTSADGRPMRAYGRSFTAGGRQYTILVTAPAARWSAYAAFPGQIFASFIATR